MSHRPINRKKANNIRKALRRSLPRYLDLVEYLKVRRLAPTTGAAEKLILDGRVVSSINDEVLGISTIPWIDEKGKPTTKQVVQRRVDASLRGKIEVASA
jgi:hypothetical protein